MRELTKILKIVSIIALCINVILIAFMLWPLIGYLVGTILDISSFLIIPIILASIDAIYLAFIIEYLIIRKRKAL